ncbi:Fur family transcriptional regulator [Hydrogenimonas thermophila]|uniref:Ferric uptake regulation protein n=1 Tax=Hydrogenimonas thermophila TaxID=223786 RepID=A0A1I5QC83_9BACT|nr:Fur family transcriptional regulator [Hydrogenimonas thermophila]WOE70831.1 Fur family transcriptional regulator [Hydrogenimonas thermophila]WOE73349.1 Fur family transcriptional regulator [Hydrogenimonas thermophila]SFP43580.1 Fur family transcriptional regulator, peroxide stress response regulator [Hydrogenimonas thermophila]
MKSSAELLKEHQLKVTPQRLKIIKMLEEYGHLNVDELYNEMLKEFPSVSLATIYKNINQMIDSGIIQEVKLPQTKSVYELIKEPHLHMICNICLNVEDIIIGTDKIIEEAEKLSGYKIEDSFMTLRGICPSCQNQS